MIGRYQTFGFTALIAALFLFFAACGETKGGIDTSIDAGSDARAMGYTLFSLSNPIRHARLIDMDGNPVHEWALGGFPVVMLPGGSLLGTEGFFGDTQGTTEIKQVSWDGDPEWSFSDWFEGNKGAMHARQHHDFQRAGNPAGYYAPGQIFIEGGNTLVLAHDERFVPSISPHTLRDDVIYEVDWSARLTGFTWHASDHFDQMGFSEAARQAIYDADARDGFLEWVHGNSIAELGENRHYDAGDERFAPANIIYSSRRANFVAIISRETGDIVWRVGPDFADAPEQGVGQFVGQHHAHMIPRGLPGAGNIMVFDNGGASGYGEGGSGPKGFVYRRDYSRVVEFDPVTLQIVWQYGAESGDQFIFSKNLSGAQRLPNGNTLITIGDNGEIIEVTESKTVVWRYVVPYNELDERKFVYRAYRLPPEWLPPGEADDDYPAWSARDE